MRPSIGVRSTRSSATRLRTSASRWLPAGLRGRDVFEVLCALAPHDPGHPGLRAIEVAHRRDCVLGAAVAHARAMGSGHWRTAPLGVRCRRYAPDAGCGQDARLHRDTKHTRISSACRLGLGFLHWQFLVILPPPRSRPHWWTALRAGFATLVTARAAGFRPSETLAAALVPSPARLRPRASPAVGDRSGISGLSVTSIRARPVAWPELHAALLAQVRPGGACCGPPYLLRAHRATLYWYCFTAMFPDASKARTLNV